MHKYVWQAVFIQSYNVLSFINLLSSFLNLCYLCIQLAVMLKTVYKNDHAVGFDIRQNTKVLCNFAVL